MELCVLFGTFVFLLMIGTPVAFCLGVSSFATIVYLGLPPVVVTFGVDPVHFGVILILDLGIGRCTPPVGAVLFVGGAVGKIPVAQAMRTIWRVHAAAFATLMMVTYIPQLSLWLPSLFHWEAT